jgi:hypothetical protein
VIPASQPACVLVSDQASMNCGSSAGTIENPARPRISAPQIAATIATDGSGAELAEYSVSANPAFVDRVRQAGSFRPVSEHVRGLGRIDDADRVCGDGVLRVAAVGGRLEHAALDRRVERVEQRVGAGDARTTGRRRPETDQGKRRAPALDWRRRDMGRSAGCIAREGLNPIEGFTVTTCLHVAPLVKLQTSPSWRGVMPRASHLPLLWRPVSITV